MFNNKQSAFYTSTMDNIQAIPVLFFPFSRPKYAQQVFDVIKEIKPKTFYFYCDKAREGNQEEIANNNTIREYINEVDWDCNLQTWFRDTNMGAYKSILDAIDWFFENEEMGIILEEDCLPSIAFFDFCRQLLPLYANDFRTWFISGNNFIEGYNPNGYDYIITSSFRQWGWATWKSRWKKTIKESFDVTEILKYKLNHQYFGSKKSGEIADHKLRAVQDACGKWKPKSWDYIFSMTMRLYGGLAIIPVRNLVSNIGVEGFNSRNFNRIVHNRNIPSDPNYLINKHPPFIVSDIKYTTRHINTYNKYFYFKLLINHIKQTIKTLLHFLFLGKK